MLPKRGACECPWRGTFSLCCSWLGAVFRANRSIVHLLRTVLALTSVSKVVVCVETTELSVRIDARIYKMMNNTVELASVLAHLHNCASQACAKASTKRAYVQSLTSAAMIPVFTHKMIPIIAELAGMFVDLAIFVMRGVVCVVLAWLRVVRAVWISTQKRNTVGVVG